MPKRQTPTERAERLQWYERIGDVLYTFRDHDRLKQVFTGKPAVEVFRADGARVGIYATDEAARAAAQRDADNVKAASMCRDTTAGWDGTHDGPDDDEYEGAEDDEV